MSHALKKNISTFAQSERSAVFKRHSKVEALPFSRRQVALLTADNPLLQENTQQSQEYSLSVNIPSTVATLLGSNAALVTQSEEANLNALILAQRVAGISEKGAFNQESANKFSDIINDRYKLASFRIRVRDFQLAIEMHKMLSKEDSEALEQKIAMLFSPSEDPIRGILQILKVLKIDLKSYSSIQKFQKSRGILGNGYLTPATAKSMAEAISAQCCKDLCLIQKLEWQDEEDCLSFVLQRALPSGNSKCQELHDSISIVWKDKFGAHHKEFAVNIKPLIEKHLNDQTNSLAVGKYQYRLGSRAGRLVAEPANDILAEDLFDTNKSSIFSINKTSGGGKNYGFIKQVKSLFSKPLAFQIRPMSELEIKVGNIDVTDGSLALKLSVEEFEKEICPLLRAHKTTPFYLYVLKYS